MNSNVKVTWTFFENTLAPNFWQGISKGCSLILDYFELEEIKVSQFINCMLFLLKIEKIVTDLQNQQCAVRKHKSFFVVFFASSSYHYTYVGNLT